MGFYLSHFFSTHFLQWLVAKNNYISMHKLPIICLGQQSMIFNLRLWFFDGCSVVLQLTFPFSLSSLFSPILVLFFSIHFGVFIFFRLVRSLNEMKKKCWWFYRGIKVWSLSGLSYGSSLKFALSRLINFLISCNNTNSKLGSNVMRRKKIIRPEDTVWLNTIFSKTLSWHLYDRQQRELI